MHDKVTSRIVEESDVPEAALKEIKGPDYVTDFLRDAPSDLLLPGDLTTFLDRECGVYWYFEYKKRMRGPRGPSFVRTATKNTLSAMDLKIAFGAEIKHVGIGVNLIDGATDYCFPGLLLFLPEVGLYGAHDLDHGVLTIFPNSNWTEIQENIGAYVLTQWHQPKKNSFWTKVTSPYGFNKLKANRSS